MPLAACGGGDVGFGIATTARFDEFADLACSGVTSDTPKLDTAIFGSYFGVGPSASCGPLGP